MRVSFLISFACYLFLVFIIISKKENALRILKFNKPEYIMESMPCYLLCYQGCNHEGYNSGGHECDVGTTWTDIWGTGWVKGQRGVMGMPVVHPLSNPEKLANYEWPDPDDERLIGKIYKMSEEYEGGDIFLGGFNRDPLWEKAHMLVGMENMLAYLYTEPEFVKEVLSKIMDFQIGIAEHYIKLGIETVVMGDDLGTQKSLLIGIDLLYEYFYPEYKRLFDLYKQNDIIINFHSCGYIEPVLEMFMDLGVDCLNPVQASANKLSAVRKITAGRMALQGGISTAVLMKGTASEIEQSVKETIKLLGKDGGYFCAPDQEMPFPDENRKAFYSALEKYGVYD